ncbi:MAG: MarR family transcriptional regulator [Gammaproteobacteria bacterium]
MSIESVLVGVATALQRHMMPRARAEGIRWSALAVLADLQTHGALTQRELAARQGITPATMSLLVRELRAGYLIDERSDPDDARRRRFDITAKGRGRLAEDRGRLAASLSGVISALGSDEQVALADALAVLQRALDC